MFPGRIRAHGFSVISACPIEQYNCKNSLCHVTGFEVVERNISTPWSPCLVEVERFAGIGWFAVFGLPWPRTNQFFFLSIGLKPYHCQVCGKDFARKCDLLRHGNSVHKGEWWRSVVFLSLREASLLKNLTPNPSASAVLLHSILSVFFPPSVMPVIDTLDAFFLPSRVGVA